MRTWRDSKGSGVQERSRDWRRSESASILAELGGGVVACAHHADDQMETLIMKMLRGTHITNLKGMAWRCQEGREGAAPCVIRPLLGVPKKDLVEFLEANDLPWMEDASNALPKYQRNRVRLELLPLMSQLAGGEGALRTRLADLATQSAQVKEAVVTEAAVWEEKHLGDGRELPVKELQQLPGLVKREVLHRFVSKRRMLPYAQVERICTQLDNGRGSEWQMSLVGTGVVQRIGDVLRVVAEEELEETEPLTVDLGQVVLTCPSHWSPAARRLPSSEAGASSTATEGVVLYNVPLGAHLVLRSRSEGDTMKMKGDRQVKVKNILRGIPVPLHLRDSVTVVCLSREMPGDEEEPGEVILCLYPGYRAAAASCDNSGIPPLLLEVAGDVVTVSPGQGRVRATQLPAATE
ncbi:unnamed protein product [Chrysoparadoxa australica]